MFTDRKAALLFSGSLFLGLFTSVYVAAAQEPASFDSAVLAPHGARPTGGRLRHSAGRVARIGRPVRQTAANGAAVTGTPDVNAAPPSGAPDTGAGQGSPGSATRNAGASGTAGGISGARRATNVQGATAAPTTPTTLPPGTLDFGNGLTMLANYTSESAVNPIGGIKQGARYTQQLFFGIDADLGKLAGLPGSSLHTIVTDRRGRSLSNDLIGNSVSVQEIYGGGQTIRLTYLSFEQKLLDDRLDFEVGRLPGQVAFLASPIYCNFQNNSVCGSPTLTFADTNFTFFPAPTWAGTLKTKLTDTVFFNIGAYQVDPATLENGDHGINFLSDKSTGFNVPFELGYATTFANDNLPRHYGVGAIIDRSSYTDPVLDAAGGQAFFSGLAPLTVFGRSAAYQRFDQMVYRPDSESQRGLTLFGLAIEGTGGRQPQDFQLQFGAVDTGPVASRPFDTLAFVVSAQKYSDLGISNVRAARVAQGLSNSNVADNQIFLELNYGIQIDPAVRLTPNLQYIVNPDQNRYPSRPTPIPDVLVVGAKLSVDLFTLAGLAKGPGSL